MGQRGRPKGSGTQPKQDMQAVDGADPAISKVHNANLYDAVAGGVSTAGFIKESLYGRNEVVLTPEEVLFKSRNAPERTQEDDFYWADRNLKPNTLPDSDLLKVIHSFTADYYHYATMDQGQSDTRSLDETALLALGILLEETSSGLLGATGDMVFVEGQPDQNEPEVEAEGVESDHKRSRVSSVGSTRSRKPSKRRKLQRYD